MDLYNWTLNNSYQGSIALFADGSNLISKIKTTVVIKSSIPKITSGLEVSFDDLIEGTKKPPCSVGADYCRGLMQVFPCFHCGGHLTPHI